MCWLDSAGNVSYQDFPWRETEMHCHPQNVSLNPLSPQCLAFLSEGLSSLEPWRYRYMLPTPWGTALTQDWGWISFHPIAPTPREYEWTSLIPLASPCLPLPSLIFFTLEPDIHDDPPRSCLELSWPTLGFNRRGESMWFCPRTNRSIP